MAATITKQEARQLALDAYAKMELINNAYDSDEYVMDLIGDACYSIRCFMDVVENKNGEG